MNSLRCLGLVVLATTSTTDCKPRTFNAESQEVVDELHPNLTADWSITEMNVPKAWSLLREKYGSRPYGDGVVVAHVDSGLAPHPELLDIHGQWLPSIDWDLARDFLHSPDGTGRKPWAVLAQQKFIAHSHGTETMSILMSPPGCSPKFEGRQCVTGVAPGVRAIPLRTLDAPIFLPLVTDPQPILAALTRAIDYAVEHKVHVITMSIGGLGETSAFEAAVKRAINHDILVVAAAGQVNGRIETAPALFEDVIGVGGTKRVEIPLSNGQSVWRRAYWEVAARGDVIDIAAPCVGVPMAHTKLSTKYKAISVNDVYQLGTPLPDDFYAHYEDTSAGTSAAAPAIAGIAALWLSYHGGHKAVVDFYRSRGSSIPLARHFTKLLACTAMVPAKIWESRNQSSRGTSQKPEPVWDTKYEGPGIADAGALLQAPLEMGLDTEESEAWCKRVREEMLKRR